MTLLAQRVEAGADDAEMLGSSECAEAARYLLFNLRHAHGALLGGAVPGAGQDEAPARRPIGRHALPGCLRWIGGIHLALSSLGATCAGAVELDKEARATYRANHPGSYPMHADVRAVEAGMFGKVDIVCGGFPSQSFSIAGARAGFDDPDKGALFFDLARLIGALSPPSVAILENVAGLISHDGGKTLDIVLGTLTHRRRPRRHAPGRCSGPSLVTPRECARMQGFPETFAHHASRNTALRQFRQLGVGTSR